MAAPKAFAAFVYKSKTSAAFKPILTLQMLRSQFLAAFVTAAFKHAAACLSCHAFTKTMYFAARTFFRLISPFHNNKIIMYLYIYVK